MLELPGYHHGQRLCCYYCGEEMLPVQRRRFWTGHDIWVHISTLKVSCLIRDQVLFLDQMLIEARDYEFRRRARENQFPCPNPHRGETDGDDFFMT